MSINRDILDMWAWEDIMALQQAEEEERQRELQEWEEAEEQKRIEEEEKEKARKEKVKNFLIDPETGLYRKRLDPETGRYID